MCLCGFRGSLKTSTTKGFVLHFLLTNPNKSVLLVEQRAENAETHVEELYFQLQTNWFLQDLYRDRLPEGLEGCSKTQLCLVRDDPNADLSLRCGGIHSGFESRHVDLLWCNDLEGADAEKSNVENEEAAFFLFNRAQPLLKPEAFQPKILVEGTPHGDRPLVHRIRKMEAGGSTDWRKRKVWQLWWQPMADENDAPTIPSLLSEERVAELRASALVDNHAKKMVAQQYDLLESVELGGGFDMEAIRRHFYQIHGGALLRYPSLEIDVKTIDPETGAFKWKYVSKTIHMGFLRYYIQGDPKHRKLDEMKNRNQRVTTAAIVVCAVSPDYHVFTMDTWIKEAGLDEFAQNYIRLYRKWGAAWTAPIVPIFEGIGAQIWFKDFVRRLEKNEYSRGFFAFPRPWDPSCRKLPKISARLLETDRQIESKEAYIMQQLQTWHSFGWLHLHPSQTALLRHHEVFPTTAEPIDGVDALAQGPRFWRPPMSETTKYELRRRALMLETIRGMSDPVGDVSPWADADVAAAVTVN